MPSLEYREAKACCPYFLQWHPGFGLVDVPVHFLMLDWASPPDQFGSPRNPERLDEVHLIFHHEG